jgi:aspartyl-tRNA(Asn)/glutamyl-tRNA(Gln) amidotransferase subunit B
VCLLEIVTFLDIKNSTPDQYITSPDEAERYLRAIQEIVRALGVSNANMEEGSMRADVNVSVRKAGDKNFRTRTETKNMVSFKFIKQAIEFEARRQIEIYESGGSVSQDTMHYDQESGATTVMRSKEDALDYRYFPDPDLLPLEITDERIRRACEAMPELPAARRARYMRDFGLSEYDARRLTESAGVSEWFESAVGDRPARAKPVANWMITELFAHPEFSMKPADLADLVDMLAANEINGRQAKDIFAKMLCGESGSPREIADKHGMKQLTDTGAIEKAVDDILAANATQVDQYRGGKVGLMGFFVGAVIKATGGRANPAAVSEILNKKLN